MLTVFHTKSSSTHTPLDFWMLSTGSNCCQALLLTEPQYEHPAHSICLALHECIVAYIVLLLFNIDHTLMQTVKLSAKTLPIGLNLLDISSAIICMLHTFSHSHIELIY